MIYFCFFSHWHTSRLTPQPSAWQRWWAQSGRVESFFFFFLYCSTFSRWLAWILLLPVLTWKLLQNYTSGHEPIKAEMGDTALEQLGEKYISTCGTDPKPATRPVEKCGLLLHRKGVCYESMINATGVPFPFSPTSPLWFCLATVLRHWHKTVCYNMEVYLSWL